MQISRCNSLLLYLSLLFSFPLQQVPNVTWRVGAELKRKLKLRELVSFLHLSPVKMATFQRRDVAYSSEEKLQWKVCCCLRYWRTFALLWPLSKVQETSWTHVTWDYNHLLPLITRVPKLKKQLSLLNKYRKDLHNAPLYANLRLDLFGFKLLVYI